MDTEDALRELIEAIHACKDSTKLYSVVNCWVHEIAAISSWSAAETRLLEALKAAEQADAQRAHDRRTQVGPTT